MSSAEGTGWLLCDVCGEPFQPDGGPCMSEVCAAVREAASYGERVRADYYGPWED